MEREYACRGPTAGRELRNIPVEERAGQQPAGGSYLPGGTKFPSDGCLFVEALLSVLSGTHLSLTMLFN